MDSVKYIGLDVHRDTISVAVVDQSGAVGHAIGDPRRPLQFWIVWVEYRVACMSPWKKERGFCDDAGFGLIGYESGGEDSGVSGAGSFTDVCAWKTCRCGRWRMGARAAM